MDYMLCCIILFFICILFFFFKQKTAYEMRISDWSSDVCSSDLMDLPSVEDGDAACAALPRPRASDVAQTRLKTRSDEPSERVSSEKRRILVLAVGFGRLRGGGCRIIFSGHRRFARLWTGPCLRPI